MPKPIGNPAPGFMKGFFSFLIAFVFPALLIQVLGARHLTDLAEDWIFPRENRFAVAQLKLSPLKDPATKNVPADAAPMQLLLFSHSGPTQERVTLIEEKGNGEKYPAISVGSLGVPALTDFRESPVAEPRPLFDVELPTRTLFAAAVVADLDRASILPSYKLVSGNSTTFLTPDLSTIVAMTRNEYFSTNILWIFFVAAAALGGKYLPKYSTLVFPGDPVVTEEVEKPV